MPCVGMIKDGLLWRSAGNGGGAEPSSRLLEQFVSAAAGTSYGNLGLGPGFPRGDPGRETALPAKAVFHCGVEKRDGGGGLVEGSRLGRKREGGEEEGRRGGRRAAGGRSI